MLVELDFVAMVVEALPQVAVMVCVKLFDFLVTVNVCAVPSVPFPTDKVDFLGILSSVNDFEPVQFTVETYTAACRLTLKDALPLLSCATVTVPVSIVPAYLSTLIVLLYPVLPLKVLSLVIFNFKVRSAYHEDSPPIAFNVHEIVD
jgi:hypothetical protein